MLVMASSSTTSIIVFIQTKFSSFKQNSQGSKFFFHSKKKAEDSTTLCFPFRRCQVSNICMICSDFFPAIFRQKLLWYTCFLLTKLQDIWHNTLEDLYKTELIDTRYCALDLESFFVALLIFFKIWLANFISQIIWSDWNPLFKS